MRPFIPENERTDDQHQEFLDAQIQGEQEFLLGNRLNNGTIVFRVVDIEGNQVETQPEVQIADAITYRDEMHPNLAVIKPIEEESINGIYLVAPTLRLSSQILFSNGQAVIYKDEWPQNPGKFHSFSLVLSKEIVYPSEQMTGSLSFYLNNETAIKEQRYQYGNEVRFVQLEQQYEVAKDKIPSPQDLQTHQFVVNG